MSKENFKIYSLDYLSNQELSEEDLYFLFETKSLFYSIIISMFKFNGDLRLDKDILEYCKKEKKWVYKNVWTKQKRRKFLNDLIKVYKNVYQYSDIKAKDTALGFLLLYGFNIKGSVKNNLFI